MKKYKALIVEDIKDTSDYILGRVRKLCPQIGKIDQALTLIDAYELILKDNYDIVFLDIQMPTGTSFDLLKKLSESGSIGFEIIFITGESAKEFTLRAIKYSALDFLYKPLDDSELIVAVNKAIDKLQRQNYNQQIKLLLSRMGENTVMHSDKIAFHLHSGVVEMVDIKDLMYLQAEGVVSVVHTTSGEAFTTNRNLGFYKEMLMIDYDFLPVSNSILVNPFYIKRYNQHSFYLTLTDETVLTASRRCGKDIKEFLTGKKRKGFGLRSILQYFKT